MAEITYEIVENIAILKTFPNGWRKELPYLSINYGLALDGN